MRRSLLAPPRQLQAHGSWPASSARGALAGPAAATERRRPLFHPRGGWLRRAERAASQFLARHAWPRVPGIHRPYDHQLRTTLTLSEADVLLAGLPRALDGLRVLLLSDPHAGAFVSCAALADAFARLVEERAELIVLAGDLTTSHLREWTTHREAFRVLRAPLGVFAVLGNHDHYTGEPARLRALIEQDGIRVLHNACATIESGGARLSLAGVDDALRGTPDLAAALWGARPPVVLVSHHPDVVFDAARHGVALVLAGHTHAGQIRVPGLGVIVRQSRYRLDYGRYRAGATDLIVSRGLGVVGLPLRVCCPPEAVILRLRAGRPG